MEQEKGKSRQVLNNAYLELLDSISKDIAKCQPSHLSNMMWALGKLREKDHEYSALAAAGLKIGSLPWSIPTPNAKQLNGLETQDSWTSLGKQLILAVSC